jgi:2-polyprenyl-3-methyl-5-hydroxy-6-metoxy-1,4-benzoquinol methylase
MQRMKAEMEPYLLEFWRDYYQDVFAKETPYLDYSNETVLLQNFAIALDGAGSISGKYCLDIGCGWGQLSRVLHALGAARVCAIDFQIAGIEALKRTEPAVEGRVMAAEELSLSTFTTKFDRIFTVELLQYVKYFPLLTIIWPLLSPGGRLIGVVPNAENEIVKRTNSRFEGRYRSLSQAEILSGLNQLSGLQLSRIRGLNFNDDQSVSAYGATNWVECLEDTMRPNRLAFVACKAQD